MLKKCYAVSKKAACQLQQRSFNARKGNQSLKEKICRQQFNWASLSGELQWKQSVCVKKNNLSPNGSGFNTDHSTLITHNHVTVLRRTPDVLSYSSGLIQVFFFFFSLPPLQDKERREPQDGMHRQNEKGRVRVKEWAAWLWRGVEGWGYPGPEPWRRLLRAEHSLNSWTRDKWEMTAKGGRMQGEETINILEAGRDVYYKKKEKVRSVRELIMSITIAARLCKKATVKMHLCLFLCWWNNYLCWLIYFKCCPFF